MLRVFGFAVVATTFTLMAGCGEAGPTLAPVSGTVTVNGAPLAFKSVMFEPEGDTPGAGGGGSTQKDGTFSVIATVPGATTAAPGLPPGRYRVTVIEPIVPIDEATVQSAESTELTPAIAPAPRPRKREIPAIYMRPESTPLVFDVPEDGAVLEVKLSTK